MIKGCSALTKITMATPPAAIVSGEIGMAATICLGRFKTFHC
jgi:hypothetical protein